MKSTKTYKGNLWLNHCLTLILSAVWDAVIRSQSRQTDEHSNGQISDNEKRRDSSRIGKLRINGLR